MQTQQGLEPQHYPGNGNGHSTLVLASPRREVWDHATLLWSVGNDIDFFIELVRKFLGSSPRTIASINTYLGDGDRYLPAVEAGARALQESLQDLAAKPASNAAAKLETAARVRDLAGAQAAFRLLQDKVSELIPAFDRIGEQLTRSEF
jgi:HPt (histidine-containing phosphotransfer) domain-containing protein